MSNGSALHDTDFDLPRAGAVRLAKPIAAPSSTREAKVST
jgi:hypothetical protein